MIFLWAAEANRGGLIYPVLDESAKDAVGGSR
jgi:hypothetical protein